MMNLAIETIFNAACAEVCAIFRTVEDPALATARAEAALKASVLTAAMIEARVSRNGDQ